MKKDKTPVIEAEIKEEKALTLQEGQSLEKPQHDTEFAHASAVKLMEIVKANNWAKRLGGSQDHLQYEAWQTVGKYYGLAVRTGEAEYVEFGNSWGFKAKATVVNEITGVAVGGAEAYCMSDEYNWKSKPKFQLASMAQTRAGSKALRQLLGFVVALAGYNPTPAEEMDGVKAPAPSIKPITMDQKEHIMELLAKKGKSIPDLQKYIKTKFDKDSHQMLTIGEASVLIQKLTSMPDKEEEKKEDTSLDLDDIAEGIERQRAIN